jgi:hypothetical protein
MAAYGINFVNFVFKQEAKESKEINGLLIMIRIGFLKDFFGMLVITDKVKK